MWCSVCVAKLRPLDVQVHHTTELRCGHGRLLLADMHLLLTTACQAQEYINALAIASSDIEAGLRA